MSVLDAVRRLLPGRVRAESLYRRAVELASRGETRPAEECLEQVLAMDPRHAKANNNLGCLLQRRGNLDDAIAHYDRAFEADPGLGEAAGNLAIAWMAKGDLERAENWANRAIALDSQSVAMRCLLADLYRAQGRRDDALRVSREATRLAPAHAGAHAGLGAALLELERLPEARAALERSLELDGSAAATRVNLALALREEGDREAALREYRAALALDPASADAHLGLGLLTEAGDQPADSIGHYRRAIELKPDFAQAHFNYALQLLHEGDYAAAWKEYEWRWGIPELRGLAARPVAPQWEGAPLAGKTMLVYTEQGFGDAIQFARFLPLLAQRGARIVLRCAPPLAVLFRDIAGVAAVVAEGQPEPPCDFSCALLSLPYRLGADAKNLSASVPYLSPPPASVARFGAMLARDAGRPKVGLVWASHSPRARLAALKSFPLSALAPLAAGAASVRFFSLQKGPSASQAVHPPAGLALSDLTRELHDFSETAALIANLDLVISTDSAVAHLAGALGRPVWTLVPSPPDWRWRRAGETCLWYPGMRLFRQRRSFEWGDVIADVAAALARWAGETREA